VPRTFKRRKRDGSIVVTLPDAARAILVHVLDDIASVVAEPPVGDVADRLYPRAYLDPTEESAEQQWQALVHDELVKSRVQAIAATRVELEGSQPIALDEDGATRWLTVLNDARLTLGTILGVTEEEPLVFAPDDPRAAASDVYALLTALQGDLVEVLLGELPATGVDDPF
jgi:hypothetical protein